MTLKNLQCQLILVFTCIGGPVLWSQTSIELGQKDFDNQKYVAAAEQFQSARIEAYNSSDSSLNVVASKLLADALLFLNEMDSAFQIVDRTIPAAQAIGDTISLIELINWKSEFLRMTGRLSERLLVYKPIEEHLQNLQKDYSKNTTKNISVGNEKLYAEVLVAYGILLFATDRDQSIAYINQSLDLSTKINDTPKIAYALNSLASIYLRENNLSKALSAGIEASKFTKDNSPTFQASIYLTIGRCLVQLRSFGKAKSYLQLAEEYASNNNLSRILARINLANAELYYISKQNKLFNEYLNEVKKYWLPKYGLDFFAKGKSLQLSYFIRENLRDSLLKSLPELENLEPSEIGTLAKSTVVNTLSNSYFYLGQSHKAFRTYENYIKAPHSFLHTGDSLNYYAFLTKYYKQTKDVSKHLEYLKKERVLVDRRKEQNRISNIYLLEDEYQQAEKERQIAQLENQNVITNFQLSNRNKLLSILTAFTSILGLLGFYILKRNQKIKEQNRTIKKSEAANKLLLSEIHGRVKESLQTISSLLHIQARDLKNEDAKLAIMEGRNRINSMALIHDHLFLENNKDRIQIKDYFDQLLDYILKSYSSKGRNILLEKEITIDNMPLEQVAAIGLIVNELVSNSMKHAFVGRTQGLLKVGFKEINGHYELSIADNGIGIDLDSERLESGFGSKIIQAFAKKLKATLKRIDGVGTTMILEFPKST